MTSTNQKDYVLHGNTEYKTCVIYSYKAALDSCYRVNDLDEMKNSKDELEEKAKLQLINHFILGLINMVPLCSIRRVDDKGTACVASYRSIYHTPFFYIRTSNFVVEAEPKLNVLQYIFMF